MLLDITDKELIHYLSLIDNKHIEKDLHYWKCDIKKRIKDNGGHCPCQIEKTKDTKCMCKSFKEQESGYCHCGLYYKE